MGLFFTSFEMREWVWVQWTSFSWAWKQESELRPRRVFFSWALKWESELRFSGPLFHELENKRASKTLTSLFFTSIEIWERVGVRVDLFFMSLKTRKWIKTPTGLFFTIIKIEVFVSYVFLVETVQTLLILMTFF